VIEMFLLVFFLAFFVIIFWLWCYATPYFYLSSDHIAAINSLYIFLYIFNTCTAETSKVCIHFSGKNPTFLNQYLWKKPDNKKKSTTWGWDVTWGNLHHSIDVNQYHKKISLM